MAPLSGDLAHLPEEENLRRMAAGELYHAFTPQLTQARARCKAALERFNSLKGPSRRQIVAGWREIVKDERPMPPELPDPQADEDQFHGTDPWIEPPLFCDYGYNLHVDPTAYVNINATFIDTTPIRIGARTLVGCGVHIYSGTHPLDPAIRNGIEGPEGGGAVTIEDDCWICGNVTICPNVTVGRGSTVGAGAVVVKDVAPFTLVAGNPARFIKKIESAWDPHGTQCLENNVTDPTGPEGAMAVQAKKEERRGPII